MTQHPYAALHAATQKKIAAFAQEYGIEEVESRIWLKVDRILKATTQEEAERLAERVWHGAQAHILLLWGKRGKKKEESNGDSISDGSGANESVRLGVASR